MSATARAVLALGAVAAILTPLATRYVESRWLARGTQRNETLEGGETAHFGVVLGYALEKDGTPTAALRDRVRLGVRLLEKGAVRRLVFSGGHPGGGLRGNKSEAEIMEAFATKIIAAGGDAGRFLLEEASTSTRENALFTEKLVSKEEGASAVVVITSPFHQLRAGLVFSKVFSKVAVAELDLVDGEASHDPVAVLREILALLYYKAKGWI